MAEQDIIKLTSDLIQSVVASDWETYCRLCAKDITSFEPEAEGYLVQGMPFHKHYFDLENQSPYAGVTTTLSCPHVRLMGDVAVIAYIRISQKSDADATSTTTTSRETRVWQRIDGEWKHVHFHRS